jgi:hypothetical protein
VTNKTSAVVNVDIMAAVRDALQDETITENGVYTPCEGYAGFYEVTVDVPIPADYIKPSGTMTITENGEYDVKDYLNAVVHIAIPDGYVIPEGTKEIDTNGIYDVSDKAEVEVKVPIPDDYIKPSGTLTITTKGEHTVTEYESVNVELEPVCIPIVISTEDEMNAILENADESIVGAIYKYTGETGTYENGALYTVEEDEAKY